jgi:hypothetical protein
MQIVGIDNGVTGSIGVVGAITWYGPIPIKKVLNYQKKKSFTNRIDVNGLEVILKKCLPAKAYLERPMVNPGRFAASASALRAFEATLIVLERLEIAYEFVDSKEWQKVLPKGLKGSEELKQASLSKATQLYPHLKDAITKQGDGDGLLIAHYFANK